MEESYKMYPGLSTYNVRIQSLGKLKRLVKEKTLIEGMICKGMKSNSVSYSHLIHGMICMGMKPNSVSYL